MRHLPEDVAGEEAPVAALHPVPQVGGGDRLRHLPQDQRQLRGVAAAPARDAPQPAARQGFWFQLHLPHMRTLPQRALQAAPAHGHTRALRLGYTRPVPDQGGGGRGGGGGGGGRLRRLSEVSRRWVIRIDCDRGSFGWAKIWRIKKIYSVSYIHFACLIFFVRAMYASGLLRYG